MLFVAPEQGEAFWANGARTGFAGVGAWLAETSNEPLTMGAIYRHLTTSDPRVFFKKELANPGLNLSVGCRRSEEHTSELQSLMRISYAVFCLKKKNKKVINKHQLIIQTTETEHTN